MNKNLLPDNDILLTGIKKAYFLFTRRIDGNITTVSPSVVNLLGYESKEFAKILPDYLLQNTLSVKRTSFIENQNSIEYEIRVNHKNGELHWLKIIELPVLNEAGEIKAFDCIAHDITKHKNYSAELVSSERTLRDVLSKSIYTLIETVESREYLSHGHHQRTSSIARFIAQELGISAESTETIRLAGIVHDIGKITVPTEILNKRALLNDTEYGFVQNHPEVGYDILRKIDMPKPLAEIVLQHHERLDGSGYPYHLKGDEILPESRIVAVADVIEAMASDRAHRPALERYSIMDELSEQRGILFDPDVIDVSLRLLSEKVIML
jgi:PAS domain S-box-containing protein/putative nucleotidyltransferase with HDIG domain